MKIIRKTRSLRTKKKNMGSLVSYFWGNTNDAVIDSATGLSGKEKRLVQESWAIIRKNPVDAGVAIMSRFFKVYPQYQKVFPSFKDLPVESLPGNKKFQAHCQSIVTTLSNAFDSLHDSGLLEANLHILGERHGRRGQGRQEFIDLKEIILNVLNESLGGKFDLETAAAWDKIMDVINVEIFKGMEK
ncbi:globin [Cephus cinctus]|uniref:Globin n=1 Tax=Cephus cinctus TaxID=211228 RepID=A0AAJ7FNQ8_CEPCN|nr:globin [Cephus cinctus]XP_015600850.1 globin [Cephus cinctus]